MSLYQNVARVLYSAAMIRGDGGYLAVSKCAKRWLVVLLPTENDREDYLWRWSGSNVCCPFGCMSALHFTREITPTSTDWHATPEIRA